MTTYIAFLRAINVGAHNRMKMAELRDRCTSLGFENVRTYIQSGDVVFETSNADADALAAEIHDAIEEAFGYDISVMVRSQAELAETVDGQPFDEPTDEDTKRYVTFLTDAPGDDGVRALESAESESESFAVNGRDVYSRVRKDLLGDGRFTDVGDVLGVPATRRNWNVVTKVHELAN